MQLEKLSVQFTNKEIFHGGEEVIHLGNVRLIVERAPEAEFEA